MQIRRMLSPVVLLLGLTLPVRAAEPEPNATITVPAVDVRSGPSEQYYATSRLRQGDRVRIVRDDGRWLAIAPPADSFSWISANAVCRNGNTAYVEAAEALVYVGSRLVNQPPSVWQVKVKRGTIFPLLGRAEMSSWGLLLTVSPAPSEVRYIPAGSARLVSSGPPPLAAPAQVVPPSYTQPTPATPTATTSASSGANPLWIEAQKAEEDGNFVAAIQMYERLASQKMATDYDLAMACLNRSQYLRNRQNNPAPAPAQTTTRAPEAHLVSNSPVRNSVTMSATSPAPGAKATSEYCYVQDSGSTVRLASPLVNNAPPPAPANQWYGPFRLERTSFYMGEKRVYRLEPSNGSRHGYITADAGLNLESQVHKDVLIYGPVAYNGYLRTWHLTALEVRPAR
jgi:hypothetical protein